MMTFISEKNKSRIHFRRLNFAGVFFIISLTKSIMSQKKKTSVLSLFVFTMFKPLSKSRE